MRTRRSFPDACRALRVLIALAVSVACVPVALAQTPEARQGPSNPQLTGMVRIWGHGNRYHPYMDDLVNAWEKGFREQYPAVRFENGMTGNASAIGGLFTGAADIAFMDREIWATELDAFQQGAGHDPFSIAVATGSLAEPNHAPALAIFVSRENPIASITLAQLDAIFGADHRRSANNIRTWGQLGLTGRWATEPIHPYAYGILRRQSQYWEHQVMKGSQKWNCDLREVGNRTRENTSGRQASRQIQDALAGDSDGIAFATLEYRNPRLKALPIAAEPQSAPIAATKATVEARDYPLVQTLYAYANRNPGKPLDPAVDAFLKFIVSAKGQEILLQQHGYLPLPAVSRDQQLEKLQ